MQTSQRTADISMRSLYYNSHFVHGQQVEQDDGLMKRLPKIANDSCVHLERTISPPGRSLLLFPHFFTHHPQARTRTPQTAHM